MKDFQLRYPQVTLTFMEGGDQTLLEELLNGQLDLMLEAERPVNSKLLSIPWASEEIVLAVPGGGPHWKAADRSFRLKWIAACSFVFATKILPKTIAQKSDKAPRRSDDLRGALQYSRST